jgi:hypothetical protein
MGGQIKGKEMNSIKITEFDEGSSLEVEALMCHNVNSILNCLVIIKLLRRHVRHEHVDI